MRKSFAVALTVIAVIGIFLCYNLFFSQDLNQKKEADIELEKEEGQDGIQLSQELDFEQTKDIKLGYVPEDRLIKASERLVAARRAMRTNPALRTTALTWTERGPYTDINGPQGNSRGATGSVTSGRMRTIHLDISDATNRTVWVGGVDGGLWKTTDVTANPANWTPINDQLGNLAVSDIAQDPTNPDIMYYGTGEKSFNADAVRGGGVWKSTDHGVTWNLLSNTTTFYNVSRLAVDNSGNVYIATQGVGLRRSTDGGATWTTITPAGFSARITEMKLSSTGRLHIVCGYYNTAVASAGYFYTDNPSTTTTAIGAGSWTAPVTTFTPTNYNVELAVAGNTVYAAPANSAFQTPIIYKSIDGGANWSATTGNPGSSVSSGQGWYCIALGVDPVNPNNVVVGGLDTYRSGDGGATWTRVGRWFGTGTGPSYIHADQHFVSWKGSQVMVATDGGLFYSNDNGLNYTERNVNLRLKQFYACAIHPTSTDYFLAGAQDNGVHQLNAPGLANSVEVTGGDGAYVHIDQDQPQFQFGSYVYNQYRRSTNGGSSWSSINYSTASIGQFINPTDYDDLNNKLYASGQGGSYIRWDNPQTGASFTRVPISNFSTNVVSHVSVSPYTANRVFFGTTGGRIVRVDNADVNTPTATTINVGLPASTVSSIAIGTDDNHLIATFSNYGAQHVWMTTNGGSSWTNISGTIPDIPVRWAIFYPNDNDKALIATEMGVFETADINSSSTVWAQDPSFPIVKTNMLQYRPSDGTIIAATHGRGIFSTQIPVTSTYVQFQTGTMSRAEAPSGISGCLGYKDYTVNMMINRAPVGDATVSLTLTSTTGTRGVDYEFTTNGNFTAPSNTVTFPNGTTTLYQPVTIRVFDDAAVESAENFTLSFEISGSSDAVAGMSNQTFSFTITDNELAPSLAAVNQTRTVGTGDVAGGYIQPFRSSFLKAKSQYIYLASEMQAAGLTAGNLTSMSLNVLTKESAQPYSGLTISLKQTSSAVFSTLTFESGTTQVYTGNYSTAVGMNIFPFSAPFAWDGVSNILVEICFDNASGTVTNGDFVSSNYTSDIKGIWQRSNTGVGCSLTAGFNSNGGLYLRPDVTFVGSTGNPVETVLNASRNARLGANHDVFLYNSNGAIMARIENLSGHDFGCTQAIIDRAGTGATAFMSTSAATFLTTKTFRVVPTTNNTSGSYRITLYYTAAEKAAWETATGNMWSNIRVVKVPSQISNYSPATPAPDGPGAVETATPTHGMFGSDYTLTATFSSGFSGFAAGIPALNPLPVTLVNFSGALANDKKSIQLKWTTSSEQNARNFDVEKSTDGVSFYKIGTVAAAGNSSRELHYNLRDNQVAAANYYRLRSNDQDGRNKLSTVILIRHNVTAQNMWVVNNPFRNHIDLRFAKKPQTVKVQLLTVTGALVIEKTMTNASEQFRWELGGTSISKGTYLLRAIVDNETFTSKLVKE
jgi:hypothetical protein